MVFEKDVVPLMHFTEDSYWGFLDLEKAYDKINSEALWSLRRDHHYGCSNVPHTNDQSQGSALSPLIFIIILDYINRRCPSSRGKKLIYADDIAINENIKEALRRTIAKWHEELHNHGMKMSLSKTEVMVVTRTEPAPRLSITINGQALKQTAAFKYIGSWVLEQGGLDQEIRARVQGIGAVWNNVSGVMYDRRMPVRLKKQICKTMVRPAALYGALELRRGL